jgi:hypothetical protein
MVIRFMIFIGWVLSAFSFVIALAGLATPGAGKLISLALIGWCLIFLPPLWHRTIKHGLPVNIVVRAVAFFTLPAIFVAMATANGYKPEVSTVKTQPEASSISVSPYASQDRTTQAFIRARNPKTSSKFDLCQSYFY